MIKENFSNQTKGIRQKYEIKKERILEYKSQDLEDLEVKFHRKIQQFTSKYDTNSKIKISWDSDTSKFQAISR
jgi:hypothetical protein